MFPAAASADMSNTRELRCSPGAESLVPNRPGGVRQLGGAALMLCDCVLREGEDFAGGAHAGGAIELAALEHDGQRRNGADTEARGDGRHLDRC